MQEIEKTRFDPWVRKIHVEGNGDPLQYSCLKNPLDRGTWQATIHGAAKSWTPLSMHKLIFSCWVISNTLFINWKSKGKLEKNSNKSNLPVKLCPYAYACKCKCVCNCIKWRRQWHPTPVLLPGKFHGRRSLVGCSPWGREESDTTERLDFHFSLSCIGEGNGTPLQCSCLENPRDRGI